MSRFTLPPEDVLRAREKLVLDHFHDEVAHPATLDDRHAEYPT